MFGQPKTKIETYKNEKVANKKIKAMTMRGWEVVNVSGQSGTYSIAKGGAGALLLGPIGLIFGRKKSKVIVTYKKD